jgi:hypothetical protein
LNDCPACGIEYDERVEDGRHPTVETDGPRRVCATVRYDKHDYGYAVLYIHEQVDRNGRGVRQDTERGRDE